MSAPVNQSTPDSISREILWPSLYHGGYVAAISHLPLPEMCSLCYSFSQTCLSLLVMQFIWLFVKGCLRWKIICLKCKLFMANSDNSRFQLDCWICGLWGLLYWLSLSPTLHYVSVNGCLRDRRRRQSYKVKYLGLALALQVSVIILLEAFLLCWIIMEVRVYACHHSSVGGGSQQASQGKEMFAFLLCHRE